MRRRDEARVLRRAQAAQTPTDFEEDQFHLHTSPQEALLEHVSIAARKLQQWRRLADQAGILESDIDRAESAGRYRDP
jgi:hypothetical protein